MIILDNIAQGSDEWFQARLGIPTASNFSKIITPTGKASTSANDYMNKLLYEWLTGKPHDDFTSDWMKRGTEMEEEARNFYEFVNDVNVNQVGIIYKDEKKLVSCSPDGLLETKGQEIKCPAPHTHVSYLLGGKLPLKYVPQVQGSMYVTDFNEWDFLSYHPEMEPVEITVKRDDEYIEKMDELITKFIKIMLSKREQLAKMKTEAN